MKACVTIFGLGFLLVSMACGGGGGGGGPTEPLPNPTISSVNPIQARPGDQVTITGSNLGGAQSSVTFAGVAAQVSTASATSIVAIVPNLAAGPATVTVTSGGRSGSFSGFNVLGAAPMISTVSPNPVRAGETLIVSGQNLRSTRGLTLSQGTVVIIDGVPLAPLSETNSEVQVRIPINLAPGNHVIRIQVGTEFSNSVPFESHIFTVTGTYAAQGPVVLNSCFPGAGDPVGTVNTFEIAMTDVRPNLTGRIGASPLTGTLTTGGSFNMTKVDQITGGTITTRVEGNLLATPQGTVGFSGRYTLSASGALNCSIVHDLIGARVSTIATSRVPSATENVWTSSQGDVRETLRNMMVLEAQ